MLRAVAKLKVGLRAAIPCALLLLAQCGERAARSRTAPATAPLQVESRLPEGDAGSRSTVTVVFDRPVAPLGAANPTPAAGRRWLVLEPEVAGAYHWVGTRTLCFTAPGGLPAATPFTARVPAGVKAQDGAILPQDVEWRFTTARPLLVASIPTALDSLVRPSDPLILLFNLAVEPDAVARAAALEPGMSWTADRPDSALLRQLDARFWGAPLERLVRLAVHPGLEPGHAYTLHLAPALRARAGVLGLEEAIDIPFRTHGGPGFLGVEAAGPGGARLSFRTPVDPDSARAYLTFDPAAQPLELWQDGTFVQAFGGIGYRRTVTVTARAGLPDLFGQRLPADETHRFTSGDREPTLQLLPRDAVLLPAASRTVALVSCGVGAVRVQAKRLSAREEIRLRTDPQRNAVFAFDQRFPAPPDANQLASREVNLESLLPKSGRGAVLVRARGKAEEGGDWDERTVLRWSDLGLAVKASAENGVAWTTHLATAQPWAGVQLVLEDAGGTAVWRGRSDSRGIAAFPGLRALGREPWQLHLIAASAGDTAVSALQGDWRLDPWRFDIPGAYGTAPLAERAFLWSDRDVYRPGETARVAGWIRRFESHGLRLSSLDSVTVQVRDPMGHDVLRRRLPVAGLGGFAFEVENARGAALGRYGIDAFVELDRGGARERHSLGSLGYEVAAFRAPAFRTTLTPRTRHLFAGGALESALSGAYYFGAPVAGGIFRWTVVRERFSYAPRGYDAFSFADPELDLSYGGLLGSGAGALDPDGRGGIRLVLPPEMPPVTQAVHLEAAVRDAAGDEVTGHTSFLFHPVPVYAGVAVQPQFIAENDTIQVRVVAVRADTALAAPGTRLQIEVVRREWRAVRKLLVGGRVGYETAQSDSIVEAREVIAEAVPLAVPFSPRLPGSYRVRVRAADSGAAAAPHPGPVAVAWFYVSGPQAGGWRPSDAVRLEMATDRPSYHEGEVAHVLLSTPVHAERALLTIEREGLLESRIVDLSGGTRVFEVLVRPEYLPNVYVGLAAVEPSLSARQAPGLPEAARLPRYVVGYVPLKVDVEARRVAVGVQPDRAQYGPGDRARVTVQLRDPRGEALAGRVAIAVVDEAVLALLGTPVPDPFGFFYQERALAVANNDTRLRLSAGSRLESAQFKAEAGGDGGEQLAARSLFTTTAYWNPAVQTDSEGRAEVEFQWPDNLTQFRIVALAAAGADRFGAGRAEVTVTKPLTVELALPRFAAAGDTLEAACVITNRGGARERGAVTMSSELELLQKPTQALELAPGASRRVAFRVRARQAGAARVRIDASLGPARDAIEMRLPVVEPSLPRTAATAVHVLGMGAPGTAALASETVLFPQRALGAPTLQVTLGASALAGARPAFEYVTGYPFECLEQRASRLLVLTLGRRLFGEGPAASGDSAQIRSQIESTVRAIERMSTPWSGFAFWDGGDAAPAWMQAWAVLALSRARAAGFPVSDGVLENATWMIARTLREGPADAARRRDVGGSQANAAAVQAQWWRESTAAFGLFAVSPVVHPGPDSPIRPADVDVLIDHVERLGVEEQQFLALALQAWSLRPEISSRIAARTLERAEVSAEFAQLPPPADAGRAPAFRTPARATSLGLYVAATVRPTDPLAVKLASGLLRLRTGGHWSTTQDDALALLALDAYRTQVEKSGGAVDVRAVLRESGTPVVALAAAAGELAQRTAVVDLAPVGPGAERVTLAYEGSGALHAAAVLRWNEDGRQARAVESGFVLERHLRRYEGEGPWRVGDLVLVTLDVVVPRASQYLALVDPLPAGLEIVQSEFRTESSQLARTVAEWGDSYAALPVTHTERGDRELRAFADAVPAGVYTHRYVARVRAAGRFTHLPAHLEAMYAPELNAATAAARFVSLAPPAPPTGRR